MYLFQFKENITLYNNAILVRVTCADKEDKNDENIVLHRHFPNIPIVGMDANGEFGWNKFENCTDYCKLTAYLFFLKYDF